MKKLNIVKSGVLFAVSYGVGVVVHNVIKTTTPVSAKTFNKVGAIIGGFVLTNMISDKATEYVEAEIDETVEQVKDVVRSTVSTDESEQID